MTQTRKLHGTAALDAMFARAKSQNRAAFLPYFCIGYPTHDESLRAIESVARIGVDGFEIGMPFSDPIADGPTIQATTQLALENGTTVRVCLDAVRTLRERGLSQPMLLMGYANPLVAYGADRFVRDARAAGADGLIVPDLPPEEAALFAGSCLREGLALIFFLAPTSNDKRIALATDNATGFIYVVSLTGITGARKDLPVNLTEYIARLRAKTDTPLVLGFGISTAEHARQLRGLTDGFIVASALIKAWERSFDDMNALAAEIFAASHTP
ncbi:MAG: tryptophan synthase subunit alpha [Chloroflexota bacterium]|nr:tryptophan synthase subunit alpha [Chloroflexota bacterium]MDE2907759.1 tryptophan synthase subunit alpha [Chloroflexota bacterium]